MPLVQEDLQYKRPFLLFNKHLETIYPAIFRKVNGVMFQRERITTPDDDFLDLDWSIVDKKKLVIISHGLEGNSTRSYMVGMVKAFNKVGIDALAWNFRGCSGEVNRQRVFYHSGATNDLDLVIKHCLKKTDYDEIYLVGFSLGGNLTLKYLGENERVRTEKLRKAAVFSVPLNLHSCSLKLAEKSNFIYARRFLKNLVKKVKDKAKTRNDLDTSAISQINSLLEFDDQFTAPIHGFKDAIDYYQRCSSINFINNINIPTLIVNAKNDPFLAQDCFPTQQLANHAHVYFEMPTQGGHVGFTRIGSHGYWSEQRAVEFITKK